MSDEGSGQQERIVFTRRNGSLVEYLGICLGGGTGFASPPSC